VNTLYTHLRQRRLRGWCDGTSPTELQSFALVEGQIRPWLAAIGRGQGYHILLLQSYLSATSMESFFSFLLPGSRWIRFLTLVLLTHLVAQSL
jgi:hypothetical protein